MREPVDILYIGNNRLPSEKADGLYVMKLCEAFAEEGGRVTLLAPKRVNPLRDDPFSYYGVKKNFSIRAVFSFDLLFFSKAPAALMKVFFLLQAVTFGIAAAFFVRQWAAASGARRAVIISHEPYTLFFLSFFPGSAVFAPVAFDLHVGVKRNFFWRRTCRAVSRFFVLTKGIGETVKIIGVRAPITISPDAVDLAHFGRDCDKARARNMLNLPIDRYLCVYAGHLYPWKGIDVILDAAQFLPPDVMIYCVGGTDRDIAERRAQIIKRAITTVIVAGRKPYGEIPQWLCAADVLLLPNSGREAISRLYTSPMKMFEYMASGRPMVASRLPSLTEILNDANALLAEADNPEALAEGILRLKNDPAYAARLAGQAKKDVARYSWEEKARTILGAFSF